MTTEAAEIPADTAPTNEGLPETEAESTPPARLRSRRPYIIAAAVAVVVGLVVGVVVTRSGSLPADGVFSVSGHVVHQATYERRVQVLEALFGVKEPDAKDTRKTDQFRRDTAKALALSMVLDRLAADEKIVVAGKTARDSLDRYITQAYPDGRSGFTRALGDRGLSESDVVDEVRRQITVSRLFEHVTGDVTVGDAAVRAFYEKNKAKIVSPEQRHVRHIVLATEDDARRVIGQLVQGAAFADVAKQSSLDQSTKDSGGDLGTLTADQLLPAFAKAAFAAQPGHVFGPVKTDLGWHVGFVDSVVPAQHLAYNDVKADLTDRLKAERRLARWQTWLRGRLKAAHVRYAKAYRPANPDEPLSTDLKAPTAPPTTPSR